MSLILGTGTVLVADDHLDVRELTGKILEMAGYDVILAADAPAAVAAFREHATELSLVVLDLSMPGGSGAATLDRIREIRADVPVLVMTGYPEESTLMQLGERPVQGFVEKPFKPPDLLEKVRDALGD